MIHCYIALKRARYLAAHGRYNEALRQLKPHLATPPPKQWENAGPFLCTTSEPYVMSARIHIQKKRYLQAEIHLNYALKKEPKRAETHLVMGRLLALKNNLKKAAHHVEKTLSLDKKNVSAMFLLAIIRGKMGDQKGAKKLFEEAKKTNPKAFRHLIETHRTPRKKPR